jgi:hypothetical protein
MARGNRIGGVVDRSEDKDLKEIRATRISHRPKCEYDGLRGLGSFFFSGHKTALRGM